MFVILIVAILVQYLWSCLGWHLHDTILAAGLFLDVIGASILAIPDIPTIHRFFFSGMVRSAVDHLRLERGARESILVEPDTDEKFVDSLYIVEYVSGEAVAESDLLGNVARSPAPSSEGFYELRKAFSEGTNDQSWNQVFGFKVCKEEEEDELRTYIMYKNEGKPDIKLKAPYHNPFDKIENKLRDSDARFRRLGLSLLVAGFLFQGIAIAV